MLDREDSKISNLNLIINSNCNNSNCNKMTEILNDPARKSSMHVNQSNALHANVNVMPHTKTVNSNITNNSNNTNNGKQPNSYATTNTKNKLKGNQTRLRREAIVETYLPPEWNPKWIKCIRKFFCVPMSLILCVIQFSISLNSKWILIVDST